MHRLGIEIVSGRRAPGQTLPSEETFEGERVSRTVMREVIKVLAAKGLVESKQKVGTRVRPRSDWNLLDPDVLAWQLESGSDLEGFAQMTELRLLIEPAAARMAAERATDSEVEALAASYRLMAAAGSNHDAYLVADLDFHQTILAACHNEMIQQLGSILRELFRMTFSFSARIPDAAARALGLHERILIAIETKDAKGAESAMTSLIEQTAAEVEESLLARTGGAV